MKFNKENISKTTDELTRPEKVTSGIHSVDLDVPPDNGGKSPRRWWGMGVAAVILVAVVLLSIPMVTHWIHYESTDDAFIEADITPIAPKIDGYVKSVKVSDNAHVKKGDLLIEIDPRDRVAKLDAAKAKVVASQADVEQANANVEAIKANIAAAKADEDIATADADYARSQADRYRGMADGAASATERENAFATERSSCAKVASAHSKLLAAHAQLATAQAQLASAKAQVEVAKSSLEQADLELSYTRIISPVDGRVAKKNVQVGKYVSPGQSLLAVVPDEVWVVANFKETQLEHMSQGQEVEIKVDAYPGEKFAGRIESIQSGTGARFSVLPPENATGNYVKVVQRVPVKIVLNDPKGKLLAPGMSVVPDVKVK